MFLSAWWRWSSQPSWKKQAELSLEWVPRDFNREADALADGVTDGFDPALEVSIPAPELPCLVLPTLLQEATCFYSSSQQSSRPPEPKRPRLKGGRLKDSQPW